MPGGSMAILVLILPIMQFMLPAPAVPEGISLRLAVLRELLTSTRLQPKQRGTLTKKMCVANMIELLLKSFLLVYHSPMIEA